jgi:DNA (cytosine-5)-methyltransferase 1
MVELKTKFFADMLNTGSQTHPLNCNSWTESHSLLARSESPTKTKRGIRSARSNGLTVGCLFAAIGGFTKAFEKAGAKVTWANEKDAFAKETFVANFPHVRHFHKPVEDLTVKGDSLESVDILTAGFPCQPFSVACEKKGFANERGTLFLHIIRLIGEFGVNKPKILLLENVQNFRTHDKGRTFKRVQNEIQKAGYWFGEKDAPILNTATHTFIPQNRPRVFMVAMSCRYRNLVGTA